MRRFLTSLLVITAIGFWVCGIASVSASGILYFSLLIPVVVVSCWALTSTEQGKGCVLFLAVALGSLTLGDLCLRYQLADTLYSKPLDRLFERSNVLADAFRFQPNARVRQAAVGGQASMLCDKRYSETRSVEYRIDRFGFRNDLPEPSGSINILVLGDSYGMSAAVTQDATWWNHLRLALGKNLYNMAVPGLPRDNVRDLIVELERLRLAPHPILLWMIFEGNDLEDAQNPERPLSPVKLSWIDSQLTRLENFQRRSPIRRLITSLTSKCPAKKAVIVREIPQVGGVLFYKPYEEAAARSEQEVANMIGWTNLRLAIKEVHEIAQKNKISVVLALAPSKEQIYGNRPYKSSSLSRLIAMEAKDRGFEFIDLSHDLAKAAELALMKSQLLWWKDDTHWNDLGEKVVAESLANVLVGMDRQAQRFSEESSSNVNPD